MASQPSSSSSGSSSGSELFEIQSFVRGVHAYRDLWEPRVGEILCLQRQPDNTEDKLAVAVMKSGFVVGHVPRNLAPLFSHFLKRSCNKAYVLITGERVNRGAGHGLEAPCVYRLYALAVYLQRIKALLEEAADLTSSSQPALEL